MSETCWGVCRCCVPDVNDDDDDDDDDDEK
jgi:hypothetical protein